MQEVWVTGIGLLSSLGEGHEAHWARLAGPHRASPRVDETAFAPYPVHPLVDVDFSRQIVRRSDQTQMGPWQLIGVYAAGLALADAGIAGNLDCLDKTNLVIAAGNGERDTAADQKVLESIGSQSDPGKYLNETLPRLLRPTLYLSELSNLLAGNISIIHKATGSSRTFKGEEIAGVSIVEDAFRRIRSGQGELFLVGGACNAEREDLLLVFELGGKLWSGAFRPVWGRHGRRGGLVLGSVGAFLVLESRDHALLRRASPYARIASVRSGRCDRAPGSTAASIRKLFEALDVRPALGPLPVLSGASGVEPALGEELAFLRGLERDGYHPIIRAFGTVLGHSVEAHFPAGLALACLAISHGAFFAPFDGTGVEQTACVRPDRVLVTGLGHWRGEGLALLAPAQ